MDTMHNDDTRAPRDARTIGPQAPDNDAQTAAAEGESSSAAMAPESPSQDTDGRDDATTTPERRALLALADGTPVTDPAVAPLRRLVRDVAGPLAFDAGRSLRPLRALALLVSVMDDDPTPDADRHALLSGEEAAAELGAYFAARASAELGRGRRADGHDGRRWLQLASRCAGMLPG